MGAADKGGLGFLPGTEDILNQPEESFGQAVGRGFKESWQQLPQLGYGLLAGAGAAAESAFGEGGLATGIKKAGVAGAQRWQDKIAARAQETDDWDTSWQRASEEGDFGALVQWFGHGLGYVAGQGVQTLATAGAGGIAGKYALGTAAETMAKGMVRKEALRVAEAEAAEAGTKLAAGQIAARAAAPEVLQQATKNVASRIGQLSAVSATAFGQEGGEIFGDLVSKADEEGRVLSGAELGRAFAASVAAGGLEFVGDKIGLDVFLGRSKLLKPTEKMPGITGRLARGAVAGVAAAPAEGATEYFQTGLEQFGKGEEQALVPWLQSEEAQKMARGALALGALGGATMGGVGGMIHGPLKEPEPTTEPKPEPGMLMLGNTGTYRFPDGTTGDQDDLNKYLNAFPPEDREAARTGVQALGPAKDGSVVFPDGTIGTAQDVERYIESLPEDQQLEARARLLNLGPQKGMLEPPGAKLVPGQPAPDPADILASDSFNEAIELALKAVGYKPQIPVGKATEIPTLTDVLHGVQDLWPKLPIGKATEVSLADVSEALLPVGEATEMLPVGEAVELEHIPSGAATEMTSGATQAWAAADAALQREVNALRINRLLDGDLLTRDGMPYGSRIAANLRARREGLTLDHVIEIPNAGWVVRPNIGATQAAPGEMPLIPGQPAGTRGTTAADILGQAPGAAPEAPTGGPVPGGGAPPVPGGPITGGPTAPGGPITGGPIAGGPLPPGPAVPGGPPVTGGGPTVPGVPGVPPTGPITGGPSVPGGATQPPVIPPTLPPAEPGAPPQGPPTAPGGVPPTGGPTAPGGAPQPPTGGPTAPGGPTQPPVAPGGQPPAGPTPPTGGPTAPGGAAQPPTGGPTPPVEQPQPPTGEQPRPPEGEPPTKPPEAEPKPPEGEKPPAPPTAEEPRIDPKEVPAGLQIEIEHEGEVKLVNARKALVLAQQRVATLRQLLDCVRA